MRQEELQSLFSKGMWFILALFVAFFVFGEIHDVHRDVTKRHQGVLSLQQTVHELEAARQAAVANKIIADGVRLDYRRLYEQIPGPGDAFRLLLALDDYGRRASLDLREISLAPLPAKAADPLQPLAVTVRISGTYEACRHFLALAESAVAPDLAGLTFAVTRLELGGGERRLEGSVTFRVLRRAG